MPSGFENIRDQKGDQIVKDYMIHAMAAKNEIRAYAITAHDTVETARSGHDTSPVVTAALGRMLMGAAMMGMMMQDDRDLITLQIRGDGPLKGITVTADNSGRVKGFPLESDVDVPAKYPGKLDVGAAVGHGFLRVMRDTGAPEPYVGTVDLVTGEIAEDLTYYFAQSEQIPSAVGLGVLVDTDCTVSCAGGFIVQLLPGTSDETISRLEDNIKKLPQVTAMLSDGLSPEEILGQVLDGFDIEFLENNPVECYCDCSKERIERSLFSLPKQDLQDMIDEGKPVEVRCQFCNKTYEFQTSELEALMG